MISKKTKNGIFILAGICFICVIGYFIYQAYWYNHPKLILGCAKSSGSLDYSFSFPVIEVRESIFGMSNHAENILKDFSKENAGLQEKISMEYEKPINIKYDVTYEHGETVFSFYGTACDKTDKSVVEINEKIVLGYIAKLREK